MGIQKSFIEIVEPRIDRLSFLFVGFRWRTLKAEDKGGTKQQKWESTRKWRVTTSGQLVLDILLATPNFPCLISLHIKDPSYL